VSASRSLLHQARSRCRSVMHLWGAWCMRGQAIRSDPDAGYDGCVRARKRRGEPNTTASRGRRRARHAFESALEMTASHSLVTADSGAPSEIQRIGMSSLADPSAGRKRCDRPAPLTPPPPLRGSPLQLEPDSLGRV
jgi:hypothetical protein